MRHHNASYCGARNRISALKAVSGGTKTYLAGCVSENKCNICDKLSWAIRESIWKGKNVLNIVLTRIHQKYPESNSPCANSLDELVIASTWIRISQLILRLRRFLDHHEHISKHVFRVTMAIHPRVTVYGEVMRMLTGFTSSIQS